MEVIWDVVVYTFVISILSSAAVAVSKIFGLRQLRTR